MSLSPTKHRTLSRHPSSPSLAVGLPPPLPSSPHPLPDSLLQSQSHPIMSLNSTSNTPNPQPRTTKSKRAQHGQRKKKQKHHRGDVSSSSATSSPVHSDAESDISSTIDSIGKNSRQIRSGLVGGGGGEARDATLFPMTPTAKSKGKSSNMPPPLNQTDRDDTLGETETEEDEHEELTPKRKVTDVWEPNLLPISAPRTERKLQSRSQQATTVKKSRSAGDGLNSTSILSSTSSKITSTSTTTNPNTTTSNIPPTTPRRDSKGKEREKDADRLSVDGRDKSDKVIVCVRIKPTTSTFSQSAYELTPNSITLSDVHPNVLKRGGKSGRESEYHYDFDALLQFPARTPELYQSKIAPLVDTAMNGFNSTIFAYGQTGSGKSFTMTGTSDELGIIPCAVDGVFDAITAEPNRAFLLRVSYIEIYNESLRDLLNFKKGPLKDEEKPVIHTAKNKVYVEPLVEEIVSTPQDVVDLLEKGNQNRKIGATDWNERSSRSHAVFTIVIESRPRDGDGDDDIRLSRLNLIDLAGSEKAVSDVERRGEGKYINQSLLALREVVHKLTEKGKKNHIPYRNSKLTHLLENALGGDSNICVICTISAEEEHCSETLETLKFAGRCSQVETKAKKNVLMGSERAVIRAKDLEIEALKRQLQNLGSQRDEKSVVVESSSDQIAELADSVAAMEARKAKLIAQLAKLNGEILTSELPRSNSGLPLSPAKKKRPRISDFTSLSTGSGRLALGLGTPRGPGHGGGDRRAVSGMNRVMEDGEMPTLTSIVEATQIRSTLSFDNDRTIAALKRSIASKDEELASLSKRLADALVNVEQLANELGQVDEIRTKLEKSESKHVELQETLNQTKEEYETNLRDIHVQLESTRNELVQTVTDRGEKIDKLETTILELRKSREELVIEDQARIDDVEKQLRSALEKISKFEEEKIRNDLNQVAMREEIKVKYEAEIKAKEEELKNVRKSHAVEIGKIKSAVQALKEQHDDSESSLQATLFRAAELENENARLVSEIELNRNQYETLNSQLSLVQRDAETARSDLDRFQKAAMARESELVTHLRTELAKERATLDEIRNRFESSTVKLREEQLKMKDAQMEVLRLKGVLEGDNKYLEDLKFKLEQSERDSIALQDKLNAQKQAKEEAERNAKESQDKFGELETRCGELETRCQEVGRERDEVRRRVDGLNGEKEALRTQFEKSELERQKAVDQLERVERELSKKKETQSRSNDEITKLNEEINRLKTELDRLNEDKAKVQIELDKAREEITSLQAKLKDALEKVDQSQIDTSSTKSQMDSVKKELELAKANIVDLQTSIELSGIEDSKIQAALELAMAEKTKVESLLETTFKEKEKIQQSLDKVLLDQNTVQIALDEALADKAKFQASFNNASIEKAELEKSLKEARVGKEGLEQKVKDIESELGRVGKLGEEQLGLVKNRLKEVVAERDRTKKEMEEVIREKQKVMELGEEGKRKMIEMEEENEKLNQQLKRMNEEAERDKVELEKWKVEIDGIKAAKKKVEDEGEKFKVDYAAILQKVQNLESQLKEANRQVKLAKDETDQSVQQQNKAESDMELAISEAVLRVKEEEERKLKLKDEELSVMKLQVEDLKKQLNEAQSSLANLPRIGMGMGKRGEVGSSPQPIWKKHTAGSASTSVVLGKTRTGGDQVEGGKENEEIERLEKVVDAQKTIIEDQRVKIKFWAEELEKQREVVRLLTQPESVTSTINSGTGSANNTPNRSSPRHVKTQSLVGVPGHHSPSRSPAGVAHKYNYNNSPYHQKSNVSFGVGGKMARTHLPTSFTARNLALPTTPPPIPMHDAQIHNALINARKSRRKTIEHDIDRLAESSTVNKIKSVFDSPEKASETTANSPVHVQTKLVSTTTDKGSRGVVPPPRSVPWQRKP